MSDIERITVEGYLKYPESKELADRIAAAGRLHINDIVEMWKHENGWLCRVYLRNWQGNVKIGARGNIRETTIKVVLP